MEQSGYTTLRKRSVHSKILINHRPPQFISRTKPFSNHEENQTPHEQNIRDCSRD